jgi:hypothetical protein
MKRHEITSTRDSEANPLTTSREVVPRAPSPPGTWTEEDELRETAPYVSAGVHRATDEDEEEAPPTPARTPARVTSSYESQLPLASTEHPDPDKTDRYRPYIVEAMAPPSVPPMVADRTDDHDAPPSRDDSAASRR